jgi:hypothetical protein
MITIEAVERYGSRYQHFRVQIPGDREDIAAVIAGLLADHFEVEKVRTS